MKWRAAVMLAVSVASAACERGGPIELIAPPACGHLIAGSWDERFVYPGVAGLDASVEAMVALPDGRIAVGGRFDNAAGLPLHNVATWDGAVWTPLGDGLPGLVRGLAVDDGGTLWAVGGVPDAGWGSYVARWDAGAWTVVVEDAWWITGIAAVTGGVAIHGGFGSIDGVVAHGLAVWDGQRWSAQGLDPYSSVSTVTRTPVGVCLGGYLAAEGLALGHRAACKEGPSWTALGSPVTGPMSVLARAPDGRWWAGGDLRFYDDPEEIPIQGIASLGDDGMWHPLDGGLHDHDGFFPAPVVSSIHFDGAGLVIAGRFNRVGPERLYAGGLARWSPVRGWQAVAAPGTSPLWPPWQVNALIVDDRGLHVAGSFGSVAATAAVNVATVAPDGTVSPWTGGRVALAPQGYVNNVVDGPGGVIVAGGLTVAGLSHAPAAVFDGAWHPLPGNPSPDDDVRAAVAPDGAIILAGRQLRRWDGTAWTPIEIESAAPRLLLVTGDGSLYLAVAAPDGVDIVRWHDGEITAVTTVVDASVVALTAFEGALVVVVTSPGGTRILIERDGRWTDIDGAPTYGIAGATVVPTFGLVVNTHAGQLLVWNGATWRSLEQPAGRVAACADGLVTVTPEVTSEGPSSRLTFFDGTGWHALASNGPGEVGSLSVTADGIYLGTGGGGEASVRRWAAR